MLLMPQGATFAPPPPRLSAEARRAKADAGEGGEGEAAGTVLANARITPKLCYEQRGQLAYARSHMKQVPISKLKDDLSRYLHEAEKQEIVITRHGKPAGVLDRIRVGGRLVRVSPGERSAFLGQDREGAKEFTRRP